MNIGRLSHRVTFQKPVKVADGRGGYRKTWETMPEKWCEFRTPKIREQVAMDSTVASLTSEIIVRKRELDIERGWRALVRAHTYEVVGVYEMMPDVLCVLVKELAVGC